MQRIFLQARCPSCHPTNNVDALKTQKCLFWRNKQESMTIQTCAGWVQLFATFNNWPSYVRS